MLEELAPFRPLDMHQRLDVKRMPQVGRAIRCYVRWDLGFILPTCCFDHLTDATYVEDFSNLEMKPKKIRIGHWYQGIMLLESDRLWDYLADQCREIFYEDTTTILMCLGA